jgi:hypothetical protein
MSEQWDGVPENPERDGDHVMQTTFGVRLVASWSARDRAFVGINGMTYQADPGSTYLGPYLTPAEITAREAASAEAMREACIAACIAERDEQQEAAGPRPISGSPFVYAAGGAEICRAAIADLPIPHASALAHPDDRAVMQFAGAMRAKMAAARDKGRRGWDDPEQCKTSFLADLLLGHCVKANRGNFVDIANLAMMLHMRGATNEAASALARALAAAEKRGMERAAKLLADWPVDDERITVEECIAIIRNAAAQEIEG